MHSLYHPSWTGFVTVWTLILDLAFLDPTALGLQINLQVTPTLSFWTEPLVQFLVGILKDKTTL